MSESSLQHDSSLKQVPVPRVTPPAKAPRKAARPAAAREGAASERAGGTPRTPARKTQPAAGATSPAPAAVAEAEEPPRRWRGVVHGMPAWMCSAVVHAIVLLILGLIGLAVQEESPEVALIASAEVETSELEELTLEADPVELEEVEMESLNTEMSDPGAISFGDVTSVTETVSAVGVGAMSDHPVGEIGALFGTEGNGMTEVGLGSGGATFFGVKSSGRKFVFVVDNSNSMVHGRFETAIAEIIRAIGKLDKSQYFYVVFYSDTAYPLFYPNTATRMMPATPENKQKLVYWLSTVHMCYYTDGEEAMSLALSMRPDGIYLLGDGAFGDKTIEKTLGVDNPHLTIHTMGFDMKGGTAAGFKKVAEKFGGKFSEVPVPPAMKELEKRTNRPRNKQRNGPWGRTLVGNRIPK